MDPRSEGENEAVLNQMQDGAAAEPVPLAPAPAAAIPAGAPVQYSGLSTLTEEDFINANLPLLPKLEEEGHGAFHWEIDNWMQLPDRAVSQTFTVAGRDWDILLFPRGNQVAEMASLYVEHKPREGEQNADWHVCAMFCLAMSNMDDPQLFKTNRTHHRFVSEESDWGFTRFGELRHIMAPVDEDTAPLLERGRVRISAYLRVIKDPLGVLWHNFHNYSSRKHTGFVGLRNQGATCYMNSLLQSLYFTNEFRNAVYQIPTENDDPTKSVALALQRVFYNLQVSGEPVDTTELTKSFGWDSIESFMQHDVQEFNRVLQDNLETKMKGTIVDGAVARLFEGKMKSYIRCVNVEYESSRVENYYDISLNVKGCATLRDSFANYCEVETLDGENKYQAEGLGLQDARKGVIFESFPPVLQLQLKRFEYDFEQDAMVKINDRHEFPPTIDLREFLSEDADHSESWTYALHGVLVHSGDLHSGHYFGLLRPSVDNKWYRFDDDRVVPVATEEVFEEYYGGEFPQPQVQTPPLPGMRARPSSKRFTNAYMLVYIREAKRGSVLCAGAAPVPEHLLRRIQEDKDEEERRVREKQEMAHTLTVKVVGSEQFARHQGFDLCYFDQRQPADNPLFSERLPRDMTLAAFHEHYAARAGLPADGFRLWTMVGRRNKTVRCEHPLVADAMGMTLAQVIESRSPRWGELRLFCEARPADAPDGFLAEKLPSETSLIHVKFYDPERQLIGGIGNTYIHRDQCVGDIVPVLRSMAMLPPDAPVTLYEEVKPSMIEEMDLATTFLKAEIQSGDIICVQATPAPEDTRPLARVTDYFDDMQHRVSVRFARLPTRSGADPYGSANGGAAAAAAAAATPEDATPESPLVLTASTKTSYDRIAQWVAEQIGMRDPLKLRFYTVSPTGQPRQPVRRMETTTLSEMLPSAMFIQPLLNAEGLPEYTVMYERLEVNIVQIENMRSVRVTYVGATMREEHPVEVLVPKIATAQALIEATYGKVEQVLRAQQQQQQREVEEQAVGPIALQFFAAGSHRIARIVTGDDRLNDLGSPGVSDVVAQRYSAADDLAAAAAAGPPGVGNGDGQSQMDTDEAPARAGRQVEVFHYYRDPAQAHSLPFLFAVYDGEPWSATWERLQRKLGMSEKELKNLGVVCGPAGTHDLRQCRVLIQGGSGSGDGGRTDSPVVGADQSASAQTPPPPPPPAVDAAGGAQPAVSRAASVQSSDGNSGGTPAQGEIGDDTRLWDVLQQLTAAQPAGDAGWPALGELAGSIGLNHVDRLSRHRNLHHERAIRIRN
ncbi:ubiquitin-specific protease ubp15 [Coemansia biformis]|uniref:ubiquitinyl hydrolase 1 n=1 Tax=Coemansia biformis TaxID=1286918 RepID=A0A9W7YFF7_9FUNG|nr:ubiquitin-specific protease ubp15 [Coemansia biformis]